MVSKARWSYSKKLLVTDFPRLYGRVVPDLTFESSVCNNIEDGLLEQT